MRVDIPVGLHLFKMLIIIMMRITEKVDAYADTAVYFQKQGQKVWTMMNTNQVFFVIY